MRAFTFQLPEQSTQSLSQLSTYDVLLSVSLSVFNGKERYGSAYDLRMLLKIIVRQKLYIREISIGLDSSPSNQLHPVTSIID